MKKLLLCVLLVGLFMAIPDQVFASSIDDKGIEMYKKIANIGKWAIIIKGGLSVIQNIFEGNYSEAKRDFMGYLLGFALLLLLPTALGEIENIFGY